MFSKTNYFQHHLTATTDSFDVIVVNVSAEIFNASILVNIEQAVLINLISLIVVSYTVKLNAMDLCKENIVMDRYVKECKYYRK